MVVNQFWFGVLITIVVEIMLVFILAIVSRGKEYRKEELDDKDMDFSYNMENPKTLIDAIHEAGGIAVLAHPACCFTLTGLDRLVYKLKKLGLDGIEVYYPYERHRKIIKFHSTDTVKKIAEKYNLIKTGGTDAHGDLKI